MIELRHLRNSVHKSKFRFDITPKLYELHYVPGMESEPNVLLTVVIDGTLKGYAIYSRVLLNGTKAYRVLDITTNERWVFEKLMNQIVENSIKEKIDFIYFKKCDEVYDDVLEKKGFMSFAESVIMIVLLNPHKLLLSLSEEIKCGKVLKLCIEGFEPISVKVGEKRIKVVEAERSDSVVQTNSKTFLKLFFRRTSLIKELFKRNVIIDNLLHLPVAIRFFNVIKQDRWYIPQADWL